ncbi:hypothetical protein E1A91_D09G028500v1 [Gossypium mustelinum]|uniref:Pentatricopeptide repeat-containing protein n=1 Tax=Gossypium mustelinum TaxID=34275 RepID=A0A5D2TES3_GOSMU|nr:hypothetical protein E1A91_D09G028500v1 [Gossypium mustelinum]
MLPQLIKISFFFSFWFCIISGCFIVDMLYHSLLKDWNQLKLTRGLGIPWYALLKVQDLGILGYGNQGIELGLSQNQQSLLLVLSNCQMSKEEVYGALDLFIAWELEFPLITVKKALKILQNEQEWKRIIQVIKWMLSKGQGRTMGTYFTLLNALAEDGRLEEAEELWVKLFSDNLESTLRIFFY